MTNNLRIKLSTLTFREEQIGKESRLVFGDSVELNITDPNKAIEPKMSGEDDMII